MLKRFFSASVLVVLVYAMASGANAFTADKRTYFTFNESVALPGVTLPAGTYMFRLADPDTTRRVIQVMDKQGTQSFAMLHTMPSYRTRPANDSEIRFLETAAGAPRAVSSWWYVGESIGYQFMYSKQQLAELNRVAAPEPVAIATEEVTEQSAEGEPVAVPPIADPAVSPDVVEGEGVPAEAAEGQIAQAQPQVDQPAPAPEPAPQPSAAAREQLPTTASPLALLVLAGLATGSVGVKMLRKS